ncbi:MAG: acetyltransferase EpsM, partial [Patiriisocius sp.]
MKKLIILGGRGIGMIAASVAQDLGTYEILGFLNDVEPVGDKVGLYKSHKIIGTSNDVHKYIENEDVSFFIGYIGMKSEKEVFEKITNLKIPKHRFATLIHPTAIIPKG